MKKNMGNIDRFIRVLIALIIIGLYMANQISGLLATIGLVISAILILTSFVSFCPLYMVFGFNTCKKNI